MIDKFIVKDSIYGPRLVLQTHWSTRIASYIVSAGIRELELNRALGWKDEDLSFLSDVPAIDALAIIDWKIQDISPIHSLQSLKGLQISTQDKTKIDFGRFPHLERCGINWRPRADSLFDCTALKWLFLYRYNGKTLSQVKNLTNLEYLTISVAPLQDLEGLISLQKLRHFGLHYLTKLTSLKGIEGLKHLEELEVTNCKKITSVNEFQQLKSLKSLNISDNGRITSIKPLESLKAIQNLFFYGSTYIVDGDLTPLINLPLQKIAFQERKHYTHKESDLLSA